MEEITEYERYDILLHNEGINRVVTNFEAVEEHRALNKSQGLRHLMFGIPALDELMDGCRGGNLIVISGYTGHGKTTLSRSITNGMHSWGYPTMWFQYEECLEDFMARFPQPQPTFFVPLTLDGNSLQWIEDRILEGILKHNIQAVFIDHLHYLADTMSGRNPSLEIGQVVRWLKRAAVKYNIVMFLLAHTGKPSGDSELSLGACRDCLPKGQLIQTVDGGMIAVEELKKGDRVYSFRSIRELQEDVVTDVWPVGKKKIYRLTTQTGKQILASDGHKFYAATFSKGGEFGPNQQKGIQGWTELRHLLVGQKIATVREYPESGRECLSPEKALALGWIIGDGHVSDHAIEISVSTLAECEYLKESIDKAWGMNCKYSPCKGKNAYRFYVGNDRNGNSVLDYARQSDMQRVVCDKKVPSDIFKSSNKAIAAFLMGLFQADGSINLCGHKENPMAVITLHSISDQLVLDVKSLLLRLGIESYIRKSNSEKSGFRSFNTMINTISIYGPDIETFMEKVGFVCEKQEKAKRVLKDWNPKKIKRNSNLYFERIKSIEYIGEMDAYDVSVRGHHASLKNNSFCVQDIITHNSSFVEQEADAVLYVWRKAMPEANKNCVKIAKFRRDGSKMGKIVVLTFRDGLLWSE